MQYNEESPCSPLLAGPLKPVKYAVLTGGKQVHTQKKKVI